MRDFFFYINKDKWWKLCLRHIYSFFVAPLFFILIFIRSTFFKSNLKKKYYLSVCSVFKDEAEFLDEWINYHLLLGVEHFYLYNNNSIDNYSSILEPYIAEGVVDLINWPNEFPQMSAFKNCLDSYKEAAVWISYIDIDEFICPINTDDIKIFLKKYESYPSVVIYWKVFGTSGFFSHNYDKYVIEQYTSSYGKLMNMGKYFLNTSFSFPTFRSPHLIFAIINIGLLKLYIPPVNEYKKFICGGLHRVSLFNRSIAIQLNHYWSKSYTMFLKNKVARSDVFSKENEEYNKRALFFPNEHRCITKDWSIQRFLIDLKLKKGGCD
jgi:hypothetical protein